ncbi:hypothetical protein Tco_0883844, partial [Tanacetum coccineum]
MLVQAQDEEQQSPSRITSSPSLSPQPTPPSPLPEPIQPTHETEETDSMPHDSPLHVVHSHGSAESSMQQHDLMVLVTKLNDRIDGLEKDLLQTKKTYSTALTKLVLRVKKLEYKLKSGKAMRKAKIVLFDDEEIAEDSSKQGRKISQINEDPTVSRVQDEETPTEIIKEHGSGGKGEMEISTASPPKGIDWNDPSVLRYHALKNKPVSIAQARRNMITYLKNQGGYKESYFKKISYNDIRPILWDHVNTFIPIGSEKNTCQEEEQVTNKGQNSSRETEEKKKETADYEEEKDELRMWLAVVPNEEEFVDPEILHTKFPIVDWESQNLGNMHVYKIIRADGNTSYHKTFESMLKSFNRHNLEVLHRLVMERFQDNTPEGYNLMLWGDLKILVDPEQDDDIWKNQNQWKIISWKLYETCGVHTLMVDVFHMAQHVLPAAQLVPQYKPIERCNNYVVLQSIPCSPECKIVGLILLDHCLSLALTATVDVPAVVSYQGVVDNVSAFFTKNLAQPWQTMFKVFNRCLTTRTSGHDQTKINILQLFHVKKEAIQYPRFIKLIVVDLMTKFHNIPKRREEDYHSIKDDVPLVSVYTMGNVLVRGMLILDAFLTAEIRETNDFKEYETVFMKVDVTMNQPQPVVSTQGTHRITPSAHSSPTVSTSPSTTKKRKQIAGESSSPQKSLK